MLVKSVRKDRPKPGQGKGMCIKRDMERSQGTRLVTAKAFIKVHSPGTPATTACNLKEATEKLLEPSIKTEMVTHQERRGQVFKNAKDI